MKYCLLLTFLCSMSCSHTPDLRSRKSLENLSDPSGRYSANLDTMTTQGMTGRAVLGLKRPSVLPAAKLNELKTDLRRVPVSNSTSVTRSNPTARVNVSEALSKSDFAVLSNASLDQIINTASRLPQTRINALAAEVANSSRCQPAQLSLAFAALTEREFPQTSSVQLATKLYEKAYDCGTGELRARAAYRLGLFALVNNDCKKSLSYWGAVGQSNEARFLFSRAEYWRNHCDQKATNKRQIAMDFYNSYPLSFHVLQEMQDVKEDLSQMVMDRPTPRVLVRTEADSKVNTLVEQIELAIENKNFSAAQDMLSWINDSKMQELEPHFMLYLGHLSNMSQDGLRTFQLLSRVFSQHPQLKSATTLRLYYPKWYYDEVQAEAKNHGLDPLLVLSLVRQESAFNRTAVSRVGARGLMQLMPATARGLDRSLTPARLMEADKNVQAGTLYFSRLMKRYNGNVVLALAAYNAGFGAVDKWVARYKVDNPLLFKDLIPYRETREYVASILRNHYWYQALENQGNSPKMFMGQSAPATQDLIGSFDIDRLLRTGIATSDTTSNILTR